MSLRRVASPYRAVQAIASAATFTGSWDMRGGDVDALTSLERTVLRKKLAVSDRSRVFTLSSSAAKSHCFEVHERLRMMPDALAAVINGCVKAVARARQCRSCVLLLC